MSHNAYIWAVRIYLADAVTQDTSIGLYTSGGASELRWIESGAILSTSPTTWSADMLLGGGIEAIQQGVDLRRRGGRATIDGLTIRVQNASRLAVVLADAGTVLSGCKTEIYEIEYNDQTGEVARSVIYTGFIGWPQWTESELEIPVESADNKRRAQMATVINNAAGGSYTSAANSENGIAIPLTFGEIDKSRMVRTTFTETIIANTDLYTNALPAGLKAFPVTSYLPHVGVNIRICLSGVYRGTPGDPNDPGDQILLSLIGKYVRIISGSGGVGNMRLISSVVPTIDPTGYVTLALYFEPFIEEPTGNVTATATNNTWLELVDVDRGYDLDTWVCHAFMDDASPAAETTVPIKLFSYDEPTTVDLSTITVGTNLVAQKKQNGYYPLPDYAYAQVVGGDKNKIELDAKWCSSTPDQLDCPRFVPFEASDITLATDTTLTKWGIPEALRIMQGGAHLTGWYNESGLPGIVTPAIKYTEGTTALAVDRDHTTIYREGLLSTNGLEYNWLAFNLIPPELPESFDFDAAYLHLKIRGEYNLYTEQDDDCLIGVSIHQRRFMGTALQKPYDTEFTANPNGIVDVECLLDEFTLSGQDTNNQYHFVNEQSLTPVTGSGYQHGYINFPLDATALKNGSLYEIGIVIKTKWSYGDIYVFWGGIYEVSLMLVNRSSIKNNVYTGIRGRIYDSTWGSRKTSSAMITTPVDAIEHVARLQNWSETGTVYNWGKAYAPGALIKTTPSTAAAGSFDAPEFGPIGGADVTLWRQKDIAVAGQIISESEGWTDAALDVFLRMSWMIMYKDTAGYECVRSLLGTTTPAPTAVTLADIIGRIDPIEEADPADVFTCPMVRYNYNYGSSKYDGVLQVTQPQAAVWSSTYTPGLSSTATNLHATKSDGEVIWDLCSALYAKYPQIESPPSELSDLPMVRAYTSALWYLYHWLQWMAKRRTGFTVPYTVGKSWSVGQRIGLQLPHQTDNQNIECIIEQVTRDKNSNRVSTRVVLLENITLA